MLFEPGHETALTAEGGDVVVVDVVLSNVAEDVVDVAEVASFAPHMAAFEIAAPKADLR